MKRSVTRESKKLLTLKQNLQVLKIIRAFLKCDGGFFKNPGFTSFHPGYLADLAEEGIDLIFGMSIEGSLSLVR